MQVLNDLYDYGLKIYQDSDIFKFSLDSLLLAEFIEVKNKDKELLDLCSGNAPLPLIIANKYDINITGIEIQKDVYELATKSIKYNNLENKIKVHNENVINIANYFPGNNFDIITCNPPFFKIEKNSMINIDERKAIARHELKIDLKKIFNIANKLLKDNGAFYLVHRPERLEEIILYANENKFHAKKIELIHSKQNDSAIMILIKFTKQSNIGAKIGSTIINRDTKTYQNIFKRR